MLTKTLGRDGPAVSAVGFGAWEISIDAEDGRAIDAIRGGVDAGMTWVDTAEVYGMGRSEELVARALEGRPDILVVTKVWHDVHGTLTADVVRAAAEASLERLGRDAIDLYLVLEPEPSRSIEETWEAMAAVADEGLARLIGVSNFSAQQVERCERVRHVDAVENQFSLIYREKHEALREHCVRAGTAFIAYGPLALGLLTGKVDPVRSFSATSWGRGKSADQLSAYQRSLFGPGDLERHITYVERLKPLAARARLPLAQVALAWVVGQDDFTLAIAGSTSVENARSNAAAGSVELEPWILEQLAALRVKRRPTRALEPGR